MTTTPHLLLSSFYGPMSLTGSPASLLITFSSTYCNSTVSFRAKKSRIALIELPSYQKSELSEIQENLDTQSDATSSKNRNCQPAPTTVIDLEKEPDGLKDIRYRWELYLYSNPTSKMVLQFSSENSIYRKHPFHLNYTTFSSINLRLASDTTE